MYSLCGPSHCFSEVYARIDGTSLPPNNNNNNNNNNNKRGFVRRNRGLFNSNTGTNHTNKKQQGIYFEAARHR